MACVSTVPVNVFYNPHGDGKIPKKAFVKQYPVIERHDMLWVWLGEPELANPDTIPDFSCQNDPRFRCVGGVIEMHGNYEIITDNLMDLTHVEYLHRGLLGSDAIKTRRTRDHAGGYDGLVESLVSGWSCATPPGTQCSTTTANPSITGCICAGTHRPTCCSMSALCPRGRRVKTVSGCTARIS